MRSRSDEREGRLASRAVQAAFLIALIVLWYLAATRWGVSPLLLVLLLHEAAAATVIAAMVLTARSRTECFIGCDLTGSGWG